MKKERKSKKVPSRQSKKKTNFSLFGYSFFDVIIMLGLLVLVGAMFYLKYAEEAFGKDPHRVEMALKGDEYYSALELSQGASLKEIRQKYRELAFIWHPDKNPNCTECKEKFEHISKAYDVILDDFHRQSKEGLHKKTKVFKSDCVTLTPQNFETQVLNNNELWMIHIYDPEEESYSEFADLWESFYKDWNQVVQIGRIDAREYPELVKFFKYNIQNYPSIVAYFPTGESELLPFVASSDPDELVSYIEGALGKFVKRVESGNAREYLKIDPQNYPSGFFSHFNVLLLRSKLDIPRTLMQFALANREFMDVAVADPASKQLILNEVEAEGSPNLLVSYNTYTLKRTKSHSLIKKFIRFSDVKPMFELLTRMTIVELYKNNLRNICGKRNTHGRIYGTSGRRLVCVIGLKEEYDDSQELLIRYQQRVTAKFEKVMSRLSLSLSSQSYDLQYAALDLSWHPELQQFLADTQSSFLLSESHMNYLIVTLDNNAYTLLSGSSFEEIHKEIANFMDVNSTITKDYFGNYNITLEDLLSSDNDTVLHAMFKSATSWFMICATIVLFVGVHSYKRTLKNKTWKYFFLLLSLCFLGYFAFGIFSNFNHYFPID